MSSQKFIVIYLHYYGTGSGAAYDGGREQEKKNYVSKGTDLLLRRVWAVAQAARCRRQMDLSFESHRAAWATAQTGRNKTIPSSLM
jgi:hypothetical protein